MSPAQSWAKASRRRRRERRVEVTLDPKVNVIVGVNGSGKTLLLNALADYARGVGISCGVYTQEQGMCRATAVAPSAQAVAWAKDQPFFSFQEKEWYSHGESHLLNIISFLLKNKEKELVFLDCPESHLHLEVQKRLLDAVLTILGPQAQVVITTHSPGIVKEGWFDKTIEMSSIVFAQ